MNKSPAFQFYASDFLVDTAEMTNSEVGAYIRLLSHQWVNGGLNSDPNRLANAVGTGLLEVWDDIKHKFELCEDGKYRNPKLEKVRQAQINYRNKQSEAGKKGAAKRWDSNPNSNPNSKKVALQSSSSTSSSVSQKKGFAPPSLNEVQAYFEEKGEAPFPARSESEKFIDFYESKGWMVGKNKMKNWKASVRNWLKRNGSNNNGQQTTTSRAKQHQDKLREIAERDIEQNGHTDFVG